MTEINYKNIKYAQMVEVSDEFDNVHRGLRVQVHGFKPTGVYIGNHDEFVPYERLRIARNNGKPLKHCRHFHYSKLEVVYNLWFSVLSSLATVFIRACHKHMYK